jgi:hypothetical protein
VNRCGVGAVVFADGLGAIGRRRDEVRCSRGGFGDSGEVNSIAADGEEADSGIGWQSGREIWRRDGKEFK